MKVALIPPNGMANYAMHGSMLMCLAHLITNQAYADYTATMFRLSGKMFTILDNGANENQQLGNFELSDTTKRLHTSELVLPDVLYKAEETFDAVMEYMVNHTSSSTINNMAVVQGVEDVELHKLVHRYAEVYKITTLGLPRLLLMATGNKSIRIDLANWIENHYPGRFELHFLGASSQWVREPYYATKYAPHVRSIDTSLPFNYGLQGEMIDLCTRSIDRPFDYFAIERTMTERTTIMHNIQVYRYWCTGKAGN
jgi:hypothetical protein